MKARTCIITVAARVSLLFNTQVNRKCSTADDTKWPALGPQGQSFSETKHSQREVV